MDEKFILHILFVFLITSEKSFVNPNSSPPPDLAKVMQLEYPIKLRAAFYYSSSMKSNKPSDINLLSYYRDVYLKVSQNFAWHNIMFIVTHEFTGGYTDTNADLEHEFENFQKHISSHMEAFADTYILLRNHHDKKSDGFTRTIGKGKLGGIGSVIASVIVEVGRAVSWNPSLAGNIIAHEVGHNMFLDHTDGKTECSCPFSLEFCTMNSQSYNLDLYQSTFDSCSVSIIKKLRLDIKLSDKFTEKNIYEICGNGIVEGTEMCDCSTSEICKVRGEESFCDWKTCSLKIISNKLFECSSGACCKDGNFLSAGTKCLNGPPNECLYNSFCNGESSDCAILMKPDGSNCSTGTGRCMHGVCITEDTNCDVFYPLKNLHVEDYCYTLIHRPRQLYSQKCVYPFCYRRGIVRSSEFPYYAMENVCFLRYDIQNNNPAIDGTPCAPNKMCVNFQCLASNDFNKCQNVHCPPETVCVRDGSCKFSNGKIYESVFFKAILYFNMIVGIVIYTRRRVFNLYTRINGKRYGWNKHEVR